MKKKIVLMIVLCSGSIHWGLAADTPSSTATVSQINYTDKVRAIQADISKSNNPNKDTLASLVGLVYGQEIAHGAPEEYAYYTALAFAFLLQNNPTLDQDSIDSAYNRSDRLAWNLIQQDYGNNESIPDNLKEYAQKIGIIQTETANNSGATSPAESPPAESPPAESYPGYYRGVDRSSADSPTENDSPADAYQAVPSPTDSPPAVTPVTIQNMLTAGQSVGAQGVPPPTPPTVLPHSM